MAYGTPADPVAGTVITVAYAVANLLDPIRWLRLLTGNADPPGSAYVVVSTSTSGTNWAKITTDVLQDGAVTTAKILDGNVTAAKLGASAVTTDKIGSVQVTLEKMAANSVAAANILDGNVTAAKMAADSVGTAAIQAVSVTLAKMAANSVAAANIVDGNVTTAKIADANVTAGKLANDAVTTAKILDANVTADKLASGAAASNLGFTPARSATGTYTGNGSSPRNITGVGFQPKLVIIHADNVGVGIYLASGQRLNLPIGGAISQDVGGFVSDGFTIHAGNNSNGVTYYYQAFG